MLNIRRENILFKKRLHHFFEVVFPLGAVRFGFVLVFVPGMQVCKLVYGGYQKRVGIQIKINGDAMPLVAMR